MVYLDYILPIALLVLAFLLKLFVDRSASLPVVIAAAFELPVDVAFLSMSFVVAYTLYSPGNVEPGLTRLLIYLIVTIFIIVGWRRAETLFERDRHWPSAFIFVACITASVLGLAITISLITGFQA
jgi:uncharacterized membrane protein YczE